MIIELPRRVPGYAMPEIGSWYDPRDWGGAVVDAATDAGKFAWDVQKQIYTVPTQLALKATTAVAGRVASDTRNALSTTKNLVGNLKGAVGGIGGGGAQGAPAAGQLPAALQSPDGGTNWPLIIGGAAAVGLVAFALLRKKKVAK